MGRWIKIYDKFLQWEWFSKAEMVQLFTYFLLKANDRPNSWQGIQIGRGQLLTTNATIRHDLGLSAQTVRTCIKRLITTGEIAYKSTNRYVIITICKYDIYQHCEQNNQQTANEQSTNKTHENQQTANEQINEQKSYETQRNTDGYENESELTNNQITIKSTSNQRAGVAKINNTIRNKNIYIKETSLTRGKENAAAEATASSAPLEAEAIQQKKFEKRENIPFKEIKDAWNEICVGYPKLHSLSESRKNKMRNRITEMGGTEKAMPLLREIFAKMQASNFLRGDNKRGWKASFDWLFENDKNWVKVYEGNYEERPEHRKARYDNGKSCNDEWV